MRTGQTAWSEFLEPKRDDVSALEQAIRLTPENADLYARIAIIEPLRAAELNKALALDGMRPSWWIMLAAGQEEAGDPAAAERSLLEATAVSDYFVPWWSLTAFYYRQGDTAKFVPAARHAVSRGTGDVQSIFQMAENLKIPPATVDRQLLPDLATPLAAWLDYVLRKPDLDAAQRAAIRLTNVGSVANRSSVLTTCEVLFQAGRADLAVALWNGVIQKGWLQMTKLSPSTGPLLNDGNFTQARVQEGFDWKLVAPGTVGLSQLEHGGMRLEFDGRQPETCDLLSQYVALQPGRKYQLKTRFRTQGIPPGSGLRWSIVAGQKAVATGEGLAGETTGEQITTFETPADAAPLRLLLSYTRLPGTTRIRGTIWIESVEIQPAGMPRKVNSPVAGTAKESSQDARFAPGHSRASFLIV